MSDIPLAPSTPPVPDPSAPTPVEQTPPPTLGWRIFSFFAYIFVFCIGFGSVTGIAMPILLLVVMTSSLGGLFTPAASASFMLTMFATYPFIVGGIYAFALLVGTWLAIATGRYFNFRVRVTPRAKRIRGRLLRVSYPILGGVVVLLFAVSLIPDVLNAQHPDISSVNDTDLQLQTVSVPQNQNAVTYLIQAASAIASSTSYDTLESIISKPDTWSTTTVHAALAQNAATLSYFQNAASSPVYQDPATANPQQFTLSSSLPPLNEIRTAAILNDIAALAAARTGSTTSALDIALRSVSVGDLMQHGQQPTIDFLVGMAVKEDALQTIQDITVHSSASAKTLAEYDAKLATYGNDVPGLVDAMKSEYIANKNLIRSLANASSSTLYFRPNESLSYRAKVARAEIHTAQSPCSAITQPALPPKLSVPANHTFWLITPNVIGNIMNNGVRKVGTITKTLKVKTCQENTLLSATRILLALKGYEQDHKGALPTSLTDLAPKYLESVPNDPFSGSAFKYDPEKRLLYSVGPDGKDVGGSPHKSWNTAPNPTFHIY